MRVRVAIVAGFLAAIGAAFAGAACSSVPTDARIGIKAPDEGQFPAVGDFLDHRCGSLDCHGNAQRNFIVYGCEGLRFDPDDAGLFPACRNANGSKTTDGEYDRTYRSLVGLEPTVMSAVISAKGAHPEELTFVRKARGTEAHKGGTLITPGDDGDTCITSWLAGTTDVTACTNAIQATP